MSLIEYPAPDTCLVHILRHGATPHNLLKPPRLQGSGVNESLTDLGRQQAECAGKYLSTRPITAVYSSPLKRAAETAEIIARPHGIANQPLEPLKEIHVGQWEGRTWPEIEAEFADSYALYREDPVKHGYPGGETGRQLIDRVSTQLEQLFRDHVGQEVVVVAHSVVIRLYLGHLLGITPGKSHWTPQSNCGISTVRAKDGKAKVLTLNATTHLMNGARAATA